MKTRILSFSLACGIIAAAINFNAVAQDANSTNTAADDQSSSNETPQPPAPADQPPDQTAPSPAPAAQAPAQPPAAAVAPATTPAPATNEPPVNATAPVIAFSPIVSTNTGDKGLRMNFRNAPLEQVLNYLSDAGGFVIHPKSGVDVTGKVTVWNTQPLTKDEAVKVLEQMLNENGYSVIRDDRTLTIIRSSDSGKSENSVNMSADPNTVPRNGESRTQIIPIHSLNVVQLVKELDSLRPSDSTLTADEAANAVVMTGTDSAIHHVMEIIKGLDSVNSSSATVRVYPLQFADSKSLASLIKDLFPNPDNQQQGRGGFNFGRFRGFGGGGPGGGFPFGGGGGGDTGENNGHTPTAKVNAVSDDHSNSLIVSAPDELVPTIDELIKSVDKPVEDTTEVRVFPLKNADAGEMADLLTSLFPDDTSSTDATRGPVRFGFGFNPFGGQQQNAGNSQSDRMKKMSHVIAVADRRTDSVVVTAGKDLMPNIAEMISQLDARNDRKQFAHFISLEHADPIDAYTILTTMFPSSSSTAAQSSANSLQNNPLLNRQQTQLQQQNSTTSSGFGGTTSGRTGGGL